MINVPLRGGLGNQMFAYSYYRYLLNNGYDARLLFWEYLFTSEHYGAEMFTIFPNLPENPPKNVDRYLSINRFLSDKPFWKKALYYTVRAYYRTYKRYRQTDSYHFDEFNYKGHRIVADGCWQNGKYLEPIEQSIRKTFEFDESQCVEQEILSMIRNTESVSVHIRRGDYLDPRFSELNVIKSEKYYLDCIGTIRERHKNPLFFIFSDDIEWCKMVFHGDEYVFVTCNTGQRSYLDMYYMSLCKHNIISNSTFSWWAAWLNRNGNKEVFVPYLWTKSGIVSSDICPPTWNFININI